MVDAGELISTIEIGHPDSNNKDAIICRELVYWRV
jgi:hypothetical protein